MTLNTSVAIGVPTDAHEVYRFCRTLVNTPEHIEPQYSSGYLDETTKRISNPIGIGMCAIVDVTYGDDGPLRHRCDEFCSVEVGGKYDTTQEQVDEHAEWMRTDPLASGWAAIEVSFDTAYGYRGAGGESCSDLHARLATELGRWLDAKSLPWKWQNEFTGEWFDRFDQLDKFGDARLSTRGSGDGA